MVDLKEFSLLREEFEAEGGTWIDDPIIPRCTWRDEHDEFHRENDLPAYISAKVKVWAIHGVRHRENGPAYVEYHGTTIVYAVWYFRGNVHRLDGPAIEYGNRTVRYFVDGVQFEDGDTDAYKEACWRFRIKHGLLEPGKLTKPARPAHTATTPNASPTPTV